jgi:three-Cys-motif partner protein
MENSDEFLLKEPKSGWGGTWTEKKLNAFAKYVAAYLTIMKKYPYWKTIYFDGFAGSGERKSQKKSPFYQQLLVSEEDEDLYKGAAERILTMPGDLFFDYYYFVDTSEKSLEKLKNKLSKLPNIKENSLIFRPGDCNHWLFELSKAMSEPSNKYASLVFLDPFGMQINWESIESLKNTRTDIWILIPTGVIVNRLLDKNGNLRHSLKLQSFFGISEEEIRQKFYHKKVYTTLFGELERVKKVTDPIEKIAELYVQRLKTIWNFVSEKPLSLENSKGVPIFHFVFASNNGNALRIANQIIKSTRSYGKY